MDELDALYIKQLAKIRRETFYLSYKLLGWNNELTQKSYEQWKMQILKLDRR